MADATQTGNADAVEPTPRGTLGFGPRENADETRQAQHTVSNDSPTDVNANAIIAREQGATLTLMGKNFEAGAARRNGLFDHIAAVLGGKQAGVG